MIKTKQIRPKEKCEWEDIEVGEVFALRGCWEIWYKKSLRRAMLLSFNHDLYCGTSAEWHIESTGDCVSMLTNSNKYKLSEKDQALWLE